MPSASFVSLDRSVEEGDVEPVRLEPQEIVLPIRKGAEKFMDEDLLVPPLVPRERVQQLTAEQIGDVPPKQPFRSVFLKGARLSKSPRSRAKEVRQNPNSQRPLVSFPRSHSHRVKCGLRVRQSTGLRQNPRSRSIMVSFQLPVGRTSRADLSVTELWLR